MLRNHSVFKIMLLNHIHNMKPLLIEPTHKTLKISCNIGLIELSGRSIMNDPIPFFNPVETWIKNYVKDPPEETQVNCRFEYIDTSSFKHIYILLKELEKIENIFKVTINWYIENNDPEILELGNILDNRINFTFNYINI